MYICLNFELNQGFILGLKNPVSLKTKEAALITYIR